MILGLLLVIGSCKDSSEELVISEINPAFRDQVLSKNYLMPVQYFEIDGYVGKPDSVLVKKIREFSLENLDNEMLLKFGYLFQDFNKPPLFFDYTIDDMKEAARGDPPMALGGDYDQVICSIIYQRTGKHNNYDRSIMIYKENFSRLDTTFAYRESLKVTIDSVEIIEEVPYY